MTNVLASSRIPSRIGLLATALGGLVIAARASAGVTVVDPAGGPGGALLQSTIDAASAGDLLIIRAGDYSQVSPIVVNGKAITLQCDAASPVALAGLKISAIGAGSRFVARGFHVETKQDFAIRPGVEVANCAGTVWLEECTIDGADGDPAPPFLAIAGAIGIKATGATDLVIERCAITGGNGAYYAGLTNMVSNGGHGARFDSSAVTVHDSTFTGGNTGGGPSPSGNSIVAGSGIWMNHTALFCAGVVSTGGNLLVTLPFSWSGAGLDATASTSRLRDSEFHRGSGPPGQTAADIAQDPATIFTYPAPAASFSVSAPVVSGNNATLTFTGVAGDTVVLFAGLAGGTTFLGYYQGALLVNGGPIAGPFVLGVVPPSGTLNVLVPTAPLPAAAPDGATLQLQAVVTAPSAKLEPGSTFVQIRAGL